MTPSMCGRVTLSMAGRCWRIKSKQCLVSSLSGAWKKQPVRNNQTDLWLRMDQVFLANRLDNHYLWNRQLLRGHLGCIRIGAQQRHIWCLSENGDCGWWDCPSENRRRILYNEHQPLDGGGLHPQTNPFTFFYLRRAAIRILGAQLGSSTSHRVSDPAVPQRLAPTGDTTMIGTRLSSQRSKLLAWPAVQG